ncbi:MAG: hemin-degrading factor [Pseudomonadota bacterium]|nr:hemin-degrading factor [Pseudomonadota bacterium]
MNNSNQAAIRTAFRQARQSSPIRHRDIAATIGISEGELIASHCGPFSAAESPLRACRLRSEWPRIVAEVETLGEVMALTRNVSCVHEKVGRYANASSNGQVGLVQGEEIDLRMFYEAWAHGFAVEERLGDAATQRSLQFFDAQGRAIHKIFLRPASDRDAFDALGARFAARRQTPAGMAVALPARSPSETPDAQIDVAGLRQAWSSLRDTHAFAGLLRRFGVTRTQALRLADPAYVCELPLCSARDLLTEAARDAVALMVFVGNPGVIQIHTGPVQRVLVTGDWINVLDPGFNLHLREDRIARCWVVKKPTRDGLVHSLELFDTEGETIAMFFGTRKPGEPERGAWRQLLAALGPGVESCAT